MESSLIHYHGTPFGGNYRERVTFLTARHALIPFGEHDDIELAGEVCQSFCIDNGAFSAWKKRAKTDWPGYAVFCDKWSRHPGFDFCIIPDVIDGDETENNQLMDWFCINTPRRMPKSPVWHMHESVDRLKMLCDRFDRVCLGSSGEISRPGTKAWWDKMQEAMSSICDEHGRPPCKLHGLRMLDPEIFSKLPLASADSTNCCRNSCSLKRFGMYIPQSRGTRGAVIAERIESHNSSGTFSASKEAKFDNNKPMFEGWLEEV